MTGLDRYPRRGGGVRRGVAAARFDISPCLPAWDPPSSGASRPFKVPLLSIAVVVLPQVDGRVVAQVAVHHIDHELGIGPELDLSAREIEGPLVWREIIIQAPEWFRLREVWNLRDHNLPSVLLFVAEQGQDEFVIRLESDGVRLLVLLLA